MSDVKKTPSRDKDSCFWGTCYKKCKSFFSEHLHVVTFGLLKKIKLALYKNNSHFKQIFFWVFTKIEMQYTGFILLKKQFSIIF